MPRICGSVRRGRMTTEQPMPIPGQEDVLPYARRRIQQLLEERSVKGFETYGTPLQTRNGRDALRDAMEECVDLLQYLCQMEMERQGGEMLDYSHDIGRLHSELYGARGKVVALEQANRALRDELRENELYMDIGVLVWSMPLGSTIGPVEAAGGNHLWLYTDPSGRVYNRDHPKAAMREGFRGEE